MRRHADLFDTAFWENVQARIRQGELLDILPYAESKRLRRAG